MNKRKKGKFKIVVALSLVAVLAGTVVGFSADVSVSEALFDSDTCTTFAAYTAKHTIPDGTIFYGTYLVNMRVLNDQIYDKMMDSATESGQDSMYYKSELGGSQWYDITSVSDIADISTLGTPITASELSSLYVKYYIDSNGIVRKATVEDDSEAICSFFDDPEPYYKPDMPEFEDFFDLFENEAFDSDDVKTALTNSGPGDPVTYSQKAEQALGNLDWSTEGDKDKKKNKYLMQEAKYDLELKNLEATYKVFVGNWQDGNGDGLDAERAECLYEIMDSIDAARRLAYFTYFISDEEDTGYDNIISLIAEADDNYQASETWGTVEENIFDSMADYEQKTIEDPGDEGTFLEQRKYSTYTSIVNAALENTLVNNYGLVFDYSDYNHIQNAVVASRDREINKLDNDLIPSAISRYKSYLTAGVSSDYKTALNSGVSEDQLDSYLTTQADALETYIGEAENYIEARELRDTADNNEAYLVTKVSEANTFYSSIKDDAFATKAKSSLAAYIKWLSGELADVEAGKSSSDAATDANSLAALQAEKEDLEEQYLEAVQNNDLDGAEQIEEQIALLDEEIANAEAALAQKAEEGDEVAAAQLSNSNTLNGLIESLKSSAIEDITNDNSDSNAINTLVAIGADDTIDELTEMFGEENDVLSMAILSAKNTYNTNASATDKKNKLASNLNKKSSGSSGTDSDEDSDDSDGSSGTGTGGSGSSSSGSSTGGSGSGSGSSSSGSSGSGSSGSTSGGSGSSSGSGSGTSGSGTGSGSGSGSSGSGSSGSGSGTGSGSGSAGSTSGTGSGSSSATSGTGTSGSKSGTGTGSSNSNGNGSAGAGTSGNKDTTGLGNNETGDEAAEMLEDLSEAEIEEVLDEALKEAVGEDLEDADAEDQIAALVALQAMDDGSNKNTEKVRDSLLSDLLNDSSAKNYIYTTYTDSNSTVFVSLKAVSAVTDFRYIFDKKHSQAFMRRESPSKTYTFKVDSTSVKITGVSKTSTMDKKAVMKTDRGSNWLYICQSASENYFDIVGVPITGKDYSIAMTSDVYTTEKDILEAIINQ